MTLLWPRPYRFYGSYDVLLGYRQEIEEIGTVEGIRGRLFIYDHCCFFAVPNLWRRSGQYVILFQFRMTQLSLEKSQIEPTRLIIFIVRVEKEVNVSVEEYALV